MASGAMRTGSTPVGGTDRNINATIKNLQLKVVYNFNTTVYGGDKRLSQVLSPLGQLKITKVIYN